jgi:hypothetical protein
MQIGLYLHQATQIKSRGVWRVVSEDSDHGCDQPFLLIDCTGWIVTWQLACASFQVPPDTQLFQHIAKFD